MNSMFLHHFANLPVYKQIVDALVSFELNRRFQIDLKGIVFIQKVNMHEENTVSLKIYLMEGNNTSEVRRFEIDHGVITNYDYMRERLQMAIPRLREKVFKLLWQDADGDEITISSDEELMIALSELKSNVVKFIVRLPDEILEPKAHISFNVPSMFDMYNSVSSWAEACPIFTELQTDQNCHACQQPISGLRYRCLECVQYYQCGDCEHKNVHPDHVMLRISKNPSLSTLIPKCMHILKSHFIRGMRCPGMAFRDKMSHCHKKDDDKEKEKRGHHHKKFRKHGHCGEKYSAPTEEPVGECPFNPQMLGGNLGDVIGAFLGMYKDVQNNQPENGKPAENSKQSENTSNATTSKNSCSMKTVEIPSGPPMPSCTSDDKMDEDVPSTSNNESQKETKIKMAVELLTEMGFNDDNKWLSRLLDHFDGDIAKTIDHLTLGK